MVVQVFVAAVDMTVDVVAVKVVYMVVDICLMWILI